MWFFEIIVYCDSDIILEWLTCNRYARDPFKISKRHEEIYRITRNEIISIQSIVLCFKIITHMVLRASESEKEMLEILLI